MDHCDVFVVCIILFVHHKYKMPAVHFTNSLKNEFEIDRVIGSELVKRSSILF